KRAGQQPGLRAGDRVAARRKIAEEEPAAVVGQHLRRRTGTGPARWRGAAVDRNHDCRDWRTRHIDDRSRDETVAALGHLLAPCGQCHHPEEYRCGGEADSAEHGCSILEENGGPIARLQFPLQLLDRAPDRIRPRAPPNYRDETTNYF